MLRYILILLNRKVDIQTSKEGKDLAPLYEDIRIDTSVGNVKRWHSF